MKKLLCFVLASSLRSLAQGVCASIFTVSMTVACFGQGSCIVPQAQNVGGQALAGAKLTVCPKETTVPPTSAQCNATTNNTVPIFSDESLLSRYQLANPVTADNSGNLYVCAAPGTYTACLSSGGTTGFCWNAQFYAPASTTGGGSIVVANALTPSAINFGTVQTSTTSPVQNVTINNTGNAPLVISSVVLSGNTDFSSSNISVCNETLAVGTSCVVPFQFSPTAVGAETATVTVNSNAPGTAPTVALSGTGTSSASFSLNINGSGSGTVSSNDGVILCTLSNGVPSGACTASYASGSTPILTATPSPGSSFSTFAGGGCSTSPCTVTVSANTTVSATFVTTLPNEILSVLATGQGGGTVTSDVGGINCTVVAGVVSGTCSASVQQGTVVTLTETPDGSSTFVNWAGPCSGNATTCAVTVNSNLSATVNFTPSTIPLSLVQTCSKSGTATSFACLWASAQTAGDIIMCGSGYGSGTVTVSSIADTKTNTYTQVPTISPKVQGGLTQVLYYAANIAAAAAGANTTTITLSSSTTGEIRCAEYAGVATASPIDVSGVGSAGTGTALSITTPPTTTLNNDLITGWTTVGSFIASADTAHGYTQRIAVTGDDMEDNQGVATGTSLQFQPTQTSSQAWIAFSVGWKAQSTSPSGTTFSLSLLGAGNGNGTVTSNFGSPTLNCTFAGGATSGTCSTRVPSGGSGTLTAVASAGSVFSFWSGVNGCSSSATCTVPTITQNSTVGATFNLSGVSNFYVNHSTGNDSNAGTQAAPWKTLQHAVDTATLGAAGTIIHAAAGAYNDITSTGTCNSFGFPSVNLCFDKGGSSTGVRVKLQCDPGAANAPAAIGQCTVAGGAYGFMVVTNNVDIVGFDIGNTASMASGIITITTTNTAGAVAAQGNSVHEIGNYVHDLASTASGPQGVGCPQNGAIGVGNHHGVIQQDFQAIGNIVERFGVFPSSTCNNTHGIYATSAPGAIIYNNIVVGVPQAGIQITATCSNRISNNTIINAKTGIDLSGGNGDTGTTCPGGTAGFNTVNNNILDDISGNPLFEGTGGVNPQCTTSTPNQWAQNMTDAASLWGAGQPYSCDTSTPVIQEAGATTFVTYNTNGVGANYQLNSTSKAVNFGSIKGISGGPSPVVPGFDILNVIRPQGAGFDIGAYESF